MSYPSDSPDETPAVGTSATDDLLAQDSATDSPTATKKPSNEGKPAGQSSLEEKALKDGQGDGKQFVAAHSKSAPWLQLWLEHHNGVLYVVTLACAAALPLIPAILILVWVVRKRTWGGSFPVLVQDYRSDVQVVVTLVAGILTYLNILALSKLLVAVKIHPGENIVFTWLLSIVGTKGVSANNLSPSNLQKGVQRTKKLSEQLFGHKLTWRDAFIGCISFALLFAPHLIWQGALTPNNTLAPEPPFPYGLVPRYDSSTEFNWANNTRISGPACRQGFDNVVYFSACPARDTIGFVGSDMAMASSIVSNDTFYGIHNKPDNTTAAYLGRSFGVGSAAGLVFVPDGSSQGILEGQNWNELGYHTKVLCSRNMTSAFKLSRLPINVNNESVGNFVIFLPSGQLPNGNNDNETAAPIIAKGDPTDALAWATQSGVNEHLLAMAVAGTNYQNLSNVQCKITFTPAQFAIAIAFDNTTSYTTVTPVKPSGQPTVLDPTGQLVLSAVNQLGLLSQLQSTPDQSELGEALLANYYDSKLTNAIFNDTDFLSSVGDAITVALDDILVYNGASQVALRSTTLVDAAPVSMRAVIGTLSYNVTALVLTSLLFVLTIVNAAFAWWTGWRKVREENAHGPIVDK